MPFGIQPIHIVIIVVVALIIFGPKRLPEVGRWLGRTITEFRKGSQEMTNAMREGMNEARDYQEQQANTIAPPVQSVPAGSTASNSAPANGKYCSKCGSPNPSDALFCMKCGNSFPTQA